MSRQHWENETTLRKSCKKSFELSVSLFQFISIDEWFASFIFLHIKFDVRAKTYYFSHFFLSSSNDIKQKISSTRDETTSNTNTWQFLLKLKKNVTNNMLFTCLLLLLVRQWSVCVCCVVVLAVNKNSMCRFIDFYSACTFLWRRFIRRVFC